MPSRESPTLPPQSAWGTDSRKRDAAKVVEMHALHGCLNLENAPAIAATYGILPAFVEAEMMKRLSEGEGK